MHTQVHKEGPHMKRRKYEGRDSLASQHRPSVTHLLLWGWMTSIPQSLDPPWSNDLSQHWCFGDQIKIDFWEGKTTSKSQQVHKFSEEQTYTGNEIRLDRDVQNPEIPSSFYLLDVLQNPSLVPTQLSGAEAANALVSELLLFHVELLVCIRPHFSAALLDRELVRHLCCASQQW